MAPSRSKNDSKANTKKNSPKITRKTTSKGTVKDRVKGNDKRSVGAVRPSILPAVKIKPAMGKELVTIWQEYISLTDWTPADRWLSNRMGGSVFSRLERLWISGMFLAGLRFGFFALFAEQKLAEGKLEGKSTKELLRTIPADNFFFWIEQRLLSDKQTTTPYRFKHTNHSEAHAMVKIIFESIQKGTDTRAVTAFDGLPTWVTSYIERRAGKSNWIDTDTHRFCRRHSSTQPLWIRLSKEKFRADVEKELKDSGFTVVKKEKTGYALRGDKNIVTLPIFKKGSIDVQDYASQQIGNAVISRAADASHIWDCCAGNGGKTVQIASAIEGAIVRVSDINDRKLVRIHERATQQNLTKSIAYVPWDGTVLPKFHESITKQGGFDIVLVDAPCSGSGTWRKNPDGRLFFEEKRLSDIVATQRKILKIASAAVKPGGWLIYGTCSFFVEENESQVERFLGDARNFVLDEMKLCGNPAADSDTTFFAAMKRMR